MKIASISRLAINFYLFQTSPFLHVELHHKEWPFNPSPLPLNQMFFIDYFFVLSKFCCKYLNYISQRTFLQNGGDATSILQKFLSIYFFKYFGHVYSQQKFIVRLQPGLSLIRLVLIFCCILPTIFAYLFWGLFSALSFLGSLCECECVCVCVCVCVCHKTIPNQAEQLKQSNTLGDQLFDQIFTISPYLTRQNLLKGQQFFVFL